MRDQKNLAVSAAEISVTAAAIVTAAAAAAVGVVLHKLAKLQILFTQEGSSLGFEEDEGKLEVEKDD